MLFIKIQKMFEIPWILRSPPPIYVSLFSFVNFWNSEIYSTITFVDSCSKCVQESENIYIVDDPESSFWCNWGRKYNFKSNFSTNITILLSEINLPRVFQCRWFCQYMVKMCLNKGIYSTFIWLLKTNNIDSGSY